MYSMLYRYARYINPIPTVANPRTSGAIIAYEIAITPKFVHFGYSEPHDGDDKFIHFSYFFRGVPASLFNTKIPMMPPMLNM